MKKIIFILIKIYQKFISFDHAIWAKPHKFRVCIHYPSCSQYAYEAIDRFGVTKGIWLGTKRVLKCNILFKGGIDPVPEK